MVMGVHLAENIAHVLSLILKAAQLMSEYLHICVAKMMFSRQPDALPWALLASPVARQQGMLRTLTADLCC